MDMMELDGLAQNVDALFGIAGLKEDLMDVAVLGASAGVAVVGGEMLFAKVQMLKDQKPMVQAGIAAALGVAGGIAAGRYVNKAVGAGIAAGLVGWAVAAVVKSTVLKGSAVAGFGQVSDRDLLLGMGVVDNDVSVSDYRPLPGQTDGLSGDAMSVMDYRPMPGQTDGLGQAGDVYATDLQPMPGVSGRSGYMSGLSSFIS